MEEDWSDSASGLSVNEGFPSYRTGSLYFFGSENGTICQYQNIAVATLDAG